MSEKPAQPTPSTPPPPPVQARAIPEPPRTQTAPQPLLPPEGSKPSVHAAPPPPPMPAPAVVLPPAAVFSPPAPAVPTAPSARLASAAKPAGPVAPRSTAIPKSAVGPVAIKAPGGDRAAGPAAHVQAPMAAVRAGESAHTEAALAGAPKRRPLSKEARIAIKTVGAILVGVLILFLIGKAPSPRLAALNTMVQTAIAQELSNAPEEEKSVPVAKDSLDILLDATLNPGLTKNPAKVYTALRYAKSTDDTDVDIWIVTFILKQFSNDICDLQLLDVLRKRKNPFVVPPLLEYCRTTGNAKAATAAIETCRTIASENDFPKFIDIIDFTPNASIRKAAEESASDILAKSINRQLLAGKVISSYNTSSNADVRLSLIRVLGATGSIKAADIIKKALASEDKTEQLAAAMALAAWPDDAMFDTLIPYLATVNDDKTRKLVFDATLRFVANPDRQRPPEITVKQWNTLAEAAKTPAERDQVARTRKGEKPGDKPKK